MTDRKLAEAIEPASCSFCGPGSAFELLQCPFCSGAARLAQDRSRSAPRWATCEKCGARTSDVGVSTDADAAARWNTRAQAEGAKAEPVAITVPKGLEDAIEFARGITSRAHWTPIEGFGMLLAAASAYLDLAKRSQPCTGPNCGSTVERLHSSECFAKHRATVEAAATVEGMSHAWKSGYAQAQEEMRQPITRDDALALLTKCEKWTGVHKSARDVAIDAIMEAARSTAQADIPREPTPAMMEAASTVPDDDYWKVNARNFWRAMYDAATAEQQAAGKDA